MQAKIKTRKTAAQSFVELIVGCMIFIPIILVLVDIVVCVMANSVNDACCRDAARVAANTDPTQQDLVTSRAQAVVSRSYKGGGYIVGPVLVGANPIIRSKPDSNTGGPFDAEVDVTTKITANMPAYFPGLTPASMDFKSEQRFPVTYILPASSTGQPP